MCFVSVKQRQLYLCRIFFVASWRRFRLKLALMTTNTRLRHIVSIFSLILMLLVAQTSGSSYVWCFGDNGHTALEQPHSNCCQAETSHHTVLTEGHDASLISGDHCGPCLDLLPNSSYASNRTRDDLLSIHSVAMVPPVDFAHLLLVAQPLHPRNTFPEIQPRISDQILQHRTIVLLN